MNVFMGGKRIALYLGGNPRKMESIPEGEGVFFIEPSSPQELADSLIDAAFWVFAQQRQFPDADVDCWIELEEGDRNAKEP